MEAVSQTPLDREEAIVRMASLGGGTGGVGGHNGVGASVTWLDQADRVRSAGGPGDIDAVLLPLEGERAVLRDKTGGHRIPCCRRHCRTGDADQLRGFDATRGIPSFGHDRLEDVRS